MIVIGMGSIVEYHAILVPLAYITLILLRQYPVILSIFLEEAVFSVCIIADLAGAGFGAGGLVLKHIMFPLKFPQIRILIFG